MKKCVKLSLALLLTIGSSATIAAEFDVPDLIKHQKKLISEGIYVEPYLVHNQSGKVITSCEEVKLSLNRGPFILMDSEGNIKPVKSEKLPKNAPMTLYSMKFIKGEKIVIAPAKSMGYSQNINLLDTAWYINRVKINEPMNSYALYEFEQAYNCP